MHPAPATIPDGPIVRPELEASPHPSRLPKAGERIDDTLDYYLGTGDWTAPPATLPEGARSLIAPAMLLECNSGLVAVVEVPGDVSKAVTSFDPKAVATGSPSVLRGTTDAGEWAAFMYDSAGGYYLGTTAIPTGHGTSTVLALECGD